MLPFLGKYIRAVILILHAFKIMTLSHWTVIFAITALCDIYKLSHCHVDTALDILGLVSQTYHMKLNCITVFKSGRL